MPNWKKIIVSGSDAVLGQIDAHDNLYLHNVDTNNSEATALVINGSTNEVEKRELGTNAFNSNTYNNYSLPLGSSSTRGGFKIGYSESGKNYPIELSSEKMYVNVPWTDNNTTYSVGDGGLSQNNFTNADHTKLNGIATAANNFSLPTAASNTLGGIKVGTNLSINGSGVLSSTNTTYSVGDGGLSQKNFTTTLKTKLDAIEAGARADQSAAEIRSLVGTGNNDFVPAVGASGTFLAHDGVFRAPSYIANTNTTYSVGDGGLTQKNFTTTLKDKLDEISAGAQVNPSVGDGGLTQKNFTTTLKSKLDGIAASATNVTNNSQISNGRGYITSFTNTVDMGSGFIIANSAGASQFTIVEDNALRFAGSGATTVAFNSVTKKVTISSTNTTYSVGDGGLTQKNFTTTLKTKLDGIAESANRYSLPLSAAGTRGGVKIGYTESGKNYPVELSSEKMFVNVPWTDNNTTYSVGDGGLSQNNFTNADHTKLNGIATSANNVTNNNQLTNGAGFRTSAQVDAAIASVVDSAPAALNTLNELAASLGDDADFAGSVTTSLSGKLSTSGKAADSNLLDGLDLHTGRNNVANRVVRTQANGYLDVGWINTTSGTAGTIDRVYCSQDGYLRYLSPTAFRAQLYSSGTNIAISSAGVISSTDTNTTYSVGDGGLSQNNFTNADHTKLDGIEAGARADQSAAEIRSLVGTGNNDFVPSAGTSGHFLAHDGVFRAPSYTTNTNTTYSVGDGGLSQNNFTNADHTKLNGIATGATNTSAPHYTSAISVGDGGLTQKNFTTSLKGKLDGIEAGARADQDLSGYLTTSGKAADSNLLDGVDSSSFLRSNTADTFTSTLTMGTQFALVANNYGRGVFGIYSAIRYQHVWGMGTSYKLTDDGTGAGNLYGLAFTHTNIGGQSKSGLSHQLLVMENGVTKSSLGTGLWTSGLITTTSYGTSANWNTAYGWGNHASAGYVTSSGNTTIGTSTNLSTSGAAVVATLTLTGGVITAHTNRNLSLANLGYSGASNANYITNNNQIANGQGFITSGGSISGNAATSTNAANSNLLDGLDLHTGRNDNTNKVVRTDSSGYIQAGWINTTSGVTGTTISRVYCSHDGYIRYMSPAAFRGQIMSPGTNVAISSTGVISSTDTNTTYSIGDGGLSQKNFTTTLKAKLDKIQDYHTATNTDVDTGTELVSAVSLSGSQLAVFFDYVVKKGTNVRAGTVTAVYNGSNAVEYSETSTADLGDTRALTLSVAMSGTSVRLSATATSNDWYVNTIARIL